MRIHVGSFLTQLLSSRTFYLFCFIFEQRFTHSFIHTRFIENYDDWLLITDITIFESSDLFLYCWRLWQCLPHDWYCTFSLFHVSSYLGDPGDTDTCWVLGMSPWTELCLCLSWRPTTNFHPHPPSHLRWPRTWKELCCNCYSKPTESCSIVCDVVAPSRGRCLDSRLSWFFNFFMFWFNHE